MIFGCVFAEGSTQSLHRTQSISMGRAFDLLQDRLGIVNTSGVRKNSRDMPPARFYLPFTRVSAPSSNSH